MSRPRVGLRRAEAADSALVLGWRNHPELVALSGSGTTVDPGTHWQWFEGIVCDPSVLFFIIQHEDRDVGVLRLDPAGKGARAVTIYLHPDETGRGIGSAALGQALASVFAAEDSLQQVEAHVLADNARSIRMFERLGFRPHGTGPDDGKVAYILRRDDREAGGSGDWPTQRRRIAGYYDALVAKHGVSARACDYGRPESQRIKYKVLAEAMPLGDASVLDVGCGFAEFAGYLAERWPSVRYHGVDITPGCIAEARKLRPDLDLRQLDILAEDPGGPFDFVTANGIFYLLDRDAEAIMRRIVARMYQLCTVAVGFNSLSGWCEDPQAGEFYPDPAAVLDYCRTLAPWVTLRHDYHPRDFTIYMYRERIA